MSRISRVVVLVMALMSVFAVLSSSAGAVSTWKSTNTTAFTAHGSPVSLSGNNKTFSCTGSTATGAVSGVDFTGAVWTNAIHGTIAYSGCILAGTPYSMSCTYSLSATAITGSQVQGALNLSSPNGCDFTVGGVVACRIEGSITALYDNPEPGDARMTIPVANPTITNGESTCPLISGTSGVGALTAQALTVTGASAPTISGT